MNETNIDSQRQDKWLKELMEACAGESAACERLREAEQALEYAKEEMRSALDLAMAKTRLAEVAMLQYIKSFRVKP